MDLEQDSIKLKKQTIIKSVGETNLKEMDLHQLTQVLDTLRDNEWESHFFRALSLAHLQLISPDPQYGPDGWPYLFAETTLAETEESFQKILQWLAQRGIGLVINSKKKLPDYIFTYGMIWFFKETGYFYLPTQSKDNNLSESNLNSVLDSENKKESVADKEKVEFQVSELKKFGEPTEAYLPTYVRKIIKEFLQQQGFLMPKILMITFDDKSYDLAFSLESLGDPPENEHQSICEALSWFLPPHYSIMLMSEKGLPPFKPLYGN